MPPSPVDVERIGAGDAGRGSPPGPPPSGGGPGGPGLERSGIGAPESLGDGFTNSPWPGFAPPAPRTGPAFAVVRLQSSTRRAAADEMAPSPRRRLWGPAGPGRSTKRGAACAGGRGRTASRGEGEGEARAYIASLPAPGLSPRLSSVTPRARSRRRAVGPEAGRPTHCHSMARRRHGSAGKGSVRVELGELCRGRVEIVVCACARPREDDELGSNRLTGRWRSRSPGSAPPGGRSSARRRCRPSRGRTATRAGRSSIGPRAFVQVEARSSPRGRSA